MKIKEQKDSECTNESECITEVLGENLLSYYIADMLCLYKSAKAEWTRADNRMECNVMTSHEPHEHQALSKYLYKEYIHTKENPIIENILNRIKNIPNIFNYFNSPLPKEVEDHVENLANSLSGEISETQN